MNLGLFWAVLNQPPPLLASVEAMQSAGETSE